MKKFLISLFILVTFATSVSAQQVMFNVQTFKIHKLSCKYAVKCTKNCIKIEKEQAKKRGGIHCKVCGG